MIFKNKNNNKQVVIGTCNCGCDNELHITKWEDNPEETEYSLSLHSPKFYEEQVGIFEIIGRRLRRAFYSLIGKDYLFMDVIFSKQEFKEFIEKLQEISK